ncbi:hypothetical protein E3V39_01825 [Gammaproteobacteria bacterium LSUCC0112]|nr:hypothetical protein E3V39_01825 [Gammaproteobacteria bacterium LSUCC0112]
MFNSISGRLVLPGVEVGTAHYRVELNLVASAPDIVFELATAEDRGIMDRNFAFLTQQTVTLPRVIVDDILYRVNLEMIPDTNPLRLRVSEAVPLGASGYSSCAALQSTTNGRFGDLLRIGNGTVGVELSAVDGTLRRVWDPRSNIELSDSSSQGFQALWLMQVNQNGTINSASNHGADSFSYVFGEDIAHNAVTLDLTWQGIRFFNGSSLPAEVTARIRVGCGDGRILWSLKANNLQNSNVVEVEYPMLGGIKALGTTGADDRLLAPFFEGAEFKDPVLNRVTVSGLYPSYRQSMQMMAVYDSAGGFMLHSNDKGFRTKSFTWSGQEDNRMRWQVSHFFSDEPINSFDLAYDVVLQSFNGNWERAAEIYREAVSSSPWVLQAKQRTRVNWFDKVGYGRLGRYQDMGYGTFIDDQAVNPGQFDLPVLATYWGWEPYGEWYYGDYLPPVEGWSAFDNFVSGVHASGTRLNLLLSGIYVDKSVPLWRSGILESAAARNKAGGLIESPYAENGVNQSWIHMSPASAAWRAKLVNDFVTLADRGVDALQFDNWPISEFDDDYSPGHPPGKGGTWQAQAYQTLLTEINAALDNAGHQDVAFTTEGFSELVIPYVDFALARDIKSEYLDYSGQMRALRAEPVPLFSFVYKPYLQVKTEYWPSISEDRPDSYHRLAYARTLVWGQMPQLSMSPWLQDKNFDAELLAFIKRIGLARVNHSSYLIEGVRLPTPQVSSPLTTIALADSVTFNGTAAAIQLSAWKAINNKRAVVLTNIAPETLSVGVPLDYASLGLVAGREYQVKVIDETGAVLSTEKMTGDRVVQLALSPLAIRVVQIESI